MLKRKHKYYGQVQLGMAMLNLQNCHLLLYSSYDDSSVIIDVPYDYEFVIQMVKTIKFNYFENMLHVLCETESHDSV